MGKVLSAEQVERFERDGWLAPIRVMSADAAQAIRERLEVISGTHQLDQLPHRDTFATGNMLTRGQEIAVDVGDARPSVIELQPGEMSLHHVRLVHGSAPNDSDDRRIGFAMRFIPTSVAQLVGDRDSATLVRGEDHFGHFDHESRCTDEHDPAMLALHQQITERSAVRLYRGTEVTTFERRR